MRRLAAVLITLAAAFSFAPSQAVDPAPVSPSKIVVFVIENHSADQIRAQAPKITALGDTYSHATNLKACTHPSRPNYVCMVAGDTKGLTSDSYKTVSGPSILGNTIKAGRSAKVIMDGMMRPNRCRTSNGGNKYAEKHNPWTAFKDERALCTKYDFDLYYLPGDVAANKLANVEFIVPNLCNDAHDCSLKTADNWIASKIALIQTGQDWQDGNVAIFITADEDDRKSGNVIPGILIHPSLSHVVVTAPLTLCGSVHKTLARFGHTPPLGKCTSDTDMATAFGLAVN